MIHFDTIVGRQVNEGLEQLFSKVIWALPAIRLVSIPLRIGAGYDQSYSCPWRYCGSRLAVPIDIAIEFKPGIPGLTILGIQDNAAVELRGIVRCALRAQGYTLPRNSGSIVVMPSPGYSRAFSGRIRDAGSLALPIALGILSASGQLDPTYIEDRLFFGSLDFGGNVTSCRGTIAVESLCQELSLQGIVSAATPRGISLINRAFNLWTRFQLTP